MVFTIHFNLAEMSYFGLKLFIDSKIKLYNDKSVLENHHLRVANDLLMRDDCNILTKLEDEELTYFKSLVKGKALPSIAR